MSTGLIILNKEAHESMVDYVIRVISESIKKGAYKEGEKLPCEAELVQLLGVSRGTLREGIKMLMALGLLVVKQGDGTYVADRYVKPIIDPLTISLGKANWSIQELSDFREKIETAVVELIIQNASDEDIFSLQEINLQMKNKIDTRCDFHEIYDTDVLFHRQMGKCTGNHLFEILYNVCLDFISMQILNLYESNPLMGYISYLLHQLLIENMLKRDVDATKGIVFEAMKNHSDPGAVNHLDFLKLQTNSDRS